MIEYAISVTIYHLGSISSRNSTHPEQWERRIEKMDKGGQCAYSAGPAEDFPTDNDAQLSFQRERQRHCVCPKFKH